MRERLLIQISTTVYSQVLICTAEWTETTESETTTYQRFNTAAPDSNPGSLGRESELYHLATTLYNTIQLDRSNRVSTANCELHCGETART